MSDAWQALRETDKELALCLLFCPAPQRDLVADIFNFANELENAIRIPSEPMLAAIRLQWWQEALASKNAADVPLVQRLQRYIDASLLSTDALERLASHWQDRVGDPDLDPAIGWESAWQLAAKAGKGGDLTEAAGEIGIAVTRYRLNQPSGTLPTAAQLRALRVSGAELRWLYLAGCLILFWNESGRREDTMLVWRLLLWRFGVSLPA